MTVSLKQCRTFSFPDGTFKDEAERLVVWWYGPIFKNNRLRSVPKIHIFLRTIDHENNLGGLVRRETVLTHVGLLRIGSVWEKGVSNSRIAYEERKFPVSFSPGGWRIVSLDDLLREGRSLYTSFHDSNYLPQKSQHKTYLIDFDLPDDKHLLIPCTEFFARCYGRSSEIKRVLATYRWEEVKERLYRPLNAPASPGTWPVRFTHRVHRHDAILLAHILYDPYAERAARRIYSQIEASFTPDQMLLEVTPWFQGDGEISVSGVPIDDGNAFLGLQILGCTQPDGATIHREREKSTTVPATDGDDTPSQFPYHQLQDIPDVIDLTDDDEPDHGSSWLDLPEDEFVILGKPRAVLDKRYTRKNVPDTRGVPVPGDETIFSTGEPHGSGKGVGQASIHAPITLESQGFLRDMWNALLYLKSAYPETVHSVSWFTFEDGFSTSPDPRLISLEPFEIDDEVETSVANWVYIDTQTKVPRGVLVIRVHVLDQTLYLMEIQRRPPKPRAGGSEEASKPPSYKGLVFTLSPQGSFEHWLRQVLSNVRHVEGVVQKLVRHCPGFADTFKHPKAKNENVPCEASVLNAFSKIGITRGDLV
ncbi:hypothetical protein [Zobellella taiwanensis]|uniref:hypothetical protein n=1 Tax=Zobellella taiwanensis TaxID=347535 RepID=UPI0011B27F45|nr:hypothetical protein [Zobellella taiwanensis]